MAIWIFAFYNHRIVTTRYCTCIYANPIHRNCSNALQSLEVLLSDLEEKKLLVVFLKDERFYFTQKLKVLISIIQKVIEGDFLY